MGGHGIRGPTGAVMGRQLALLTTSPETPVLELAANKLAVRRQQPPIPFYMAVVGPPKCHSRGGHANTFGKGVGFYRFKENV